LAIQKSVAHERGSSADFPGVRVGLHVGEVLVARVGSTARLNHESKREAWTQLEAFMGSAEPGTVLMSEATRPFLERRFVVALFADSDETAARAYRLAGLRRTALGLGEKLTPLVGRDRELEQLALALEHVRKGHGQVIGVVGEAGVGKSRLFWEFIESHRSRDLLILVSSAASYGKETPYLPVIDLLKAYFRIDPRDDADKVRERVTEKVLSLERALAPSLSAILALLDVPAADAQWQELDPQQKRRRTLEAVKVLLLEESRRALTIQFAPALYGLFNLAKLGSGHPFPDSRVFGEGSPISRDTLDDIAEALAGCFLLLEELVGLPVQGDCFCLHGLCTDTV